MWYLDIFSLNLESKVFGFTPILHFTNKVKQLIGTQIKKQALISLFLIGIFNGLLPCGFVYIGLMGSIATGNVLEGMAYMALFGVGTIPLMLATSLAGPLISLRSRRIIKKLTPVFILFFAVLFIVRGLNLGIPFLSPEINTEQHSVSCH